MGGAALPGRGNRLSLGSALPEDVLTSGARVTMLGRSAVLVEGQQGVLELGADRLRLQTRDGVLSICGQALRLEELSLDAAMIRGERIDLAAYDGADAR